MLDLAGQCLGVIQRTDGFLFFAWSHTLTGYFSRHADLFQALVEVFNDRVQSHSLAFDHDLVFALGLEPQRIDDFLHGAEFVECEFLVVARASSSLKQNRLDVCVQVRVVCFELLDELGRLDITRAKAVVAKNEACGIDQINVAILGHLCIGLEDLGKTVDCLVDLFACVDSLERQLVVEQLVLFGFGRFSDLACLRCFGAFFGGACFCQGVVTRANLADHLVAND